MNRAYLYTFVDKETDDYGYRVTYEDEKDIEMRIRDEGYNSVDDMLDDDFVCESMGDIFQEFFEMFKWSSGRNDPIDSVAEIMIDLPLQDIEANPPGAAG